MRLIASVLITATFYTAGLFGYGYGNGFCCGYSGPPLCPGSFSFTERGGIEPAYYTCRQSSDVTNIVALCESQVDSTDVANTFIIEGTLLTQKESKRADQFCDQFDLPWFVGGELAYALNCNTEIFIDGFYSRGNGRSKSYTVVFEGVDGVLCTEENPLKPEETVRIKEKYSDIKSTGGHLGARFYFPCFCSCVYPFIGGKIGARYRDSVKTDLEVTFTDDVNGEVEVDAGKFKFYRSQTVLSAGIQTGFNIKVSNCLSFVIMGEVIGTGAYKYHKDVEIERGVINECDEVDGTVFTLGEASTILQVPVRRSGTILTFPIHLGLRLSF